MLCWRETSDECSRASVQSSVIERSKAPPGIEELMPWLMRLIDSTWSMNACVRVSGPYKHTWWSMCSVMCAAAAAAVWCGSLALVGTRPIDSQSVSPGSRDCNEVLVRSVLYRTRSHTRPHSTAHDRHGTAHDRRSTALDRIGPQKTAHSTAPDRTRIYETAEDRTRPHTTARDRTHDRT
jgi:hypothetical protein